MYKMTLMIFSLSKYLYLRKLRTVVLKCILQYAQKQDRFRDFKMQIFPQPSFHFFHTYDAIFFNGVAHIIMGREESLPYLSEHTYTHISNNRGHCTPLRVPSMKPLLKITCLVRLIFQYKHHNTTTLLPCATK